MANAKWQDIRRAKVPSGQESKLVAGVDALDLALSLREIRLKHGVTQIVLAERLGKSQGNVSELERRDDVFLSSLREYIEALGGRMVVAAIFDDETAPISIRWERQPGRE